MATGGSDFTSDEIVHIKCSVCAEKNMVREAERYCLDCKDYYCTTCVDMHQLIPALRRHKILDKADFSSVGPDGSLPSYPTERCRQHQMEVINFYCKDHDVVTCSHCVALDHRSCKNVVFISEDVDVLYNKREVDEMRPRLYTTTKALEEIKKHKEECLETLKETLKQAEKSITEFRKEIEALLDKLEQKTMEKMKTCYDKIEATLSKDMVDAKQLIQQLREATEQLQKARGNKVQEFVCIKSHANLANQDQLCNPFIREENEKLCFIAEHSIKQFLEEKRTFARSFVQEVSPSRLSSPKTSLYKVKKQKEVDVQIQGEYTGSIYGSCITEGGFVLLADWQNCKIQRFDLSTETVRDNIKLTPGQPLSVCQINNSEVAVTMNNKSVQFVSIDRKMSVTRTINCDHYCYGAVYRDCKLLITDAGNTLYVHDMNGQNMRWLTARSSGQKILNDSRHAAISAGGDRIYVADAQNGLIILDGQGNHISTIKPPDGGGFHGVCTDSRNIFVCNHGNKNIYQIGPDLQMLGILTTVPYILAYLTGIVWEILVT